jgi:peptidyl-prolyl cis-trans isomerase B (cyclophilin B)
VSPAVWGTPRVELSTSWGKIKLELDAARAPKTVSNFLKYVRSGHYNGTIFHRVIGDFMIQGGGFDTNYSEKPTDTRVQNEADNGLSNLRGTVAMARTPDPHSAGAQFFINVVDNQRLDHRSKTPEGWGYCVFGKVVDGMDVVDKIKAVATGAKGPFSQDAPLTEVVINEAKVVP